jgi:acetyl-CoA acetyltransferase
VVRSGIDPASSEDVVVGCVSQVGEQSFHIGRKMVMAPTCRTACPPSASTGNAEFTSKLCTSPRRP